MYGIGTGDGVDPRKVEHKYGSRDRSGDGVDHSSHYLMFDRGGNRDGFPLHLRWDIYGTGTGHGVDPQKVEQKYGSGDWVDPPQR